MAGRVSMTKRALKQMRPQSLIAEATRVFTFSAEIIQTKADFQFSLEIVCEN